MGLNLFLYVADESIESPYLSRAFKDEIIFEWYLKFDTFLNPEEKKILLPNSYGEVVIGEKKTIEEKDKTNFLDKIQKALSGISSHNEMNKLFDEFLITSNKVEDRERDPQKLREVLQKVERQLMEKSSELPLVHSIYKSKDLKNETEFITIDNISAHIEGDMFHSDNYENIRNKIRVSSYNEDVGKIDLWIDVTPEILINNETYYTKTITKAEQFEPDFRSCYHFLDVAINSNRKVLWEIG